MLVNVRKACQLHDNALNLQVAEAIVRFDDVTGDPDKGRAFIETTYITEGLDALLRGATRRLAGKSAESSFHLKQAMGGGKTHSITALSYIARHPELRQEVLPGLPEAKQFDGVRFAAFNGRERPENFFWGQLVHQLDASDHLKSDLADPPDESGWIEIFKKDETPVLIVLDELPPYFEYLNTVTIGGGTMADRAANAFASMLSASHRLTNVCVVVSDLAGTYGAGSRIINRALSNARGELNRQEVSITPVDLDSDEVYAILRKRLIKQMPSETVIDSVGEAYAKALQSAGAANIVDKGAEQITKEIETTYPFHPETKHLFAMFKDNPDFRQTRGLMELGSLLLKSVWESERDTYLVGPQHFDLSIREVGDRLADISKLSAAIAKDIYDTSESAAAQIIDADLGNTAASEAAALLLTASMSTTGDANRGLRVRDAMAVLVNPLGGEEDYQNAIDRLYKRAQYMHKSPEDRFYFDRQVNLNVLLSDHAKNAPENRVNEIVTHRLKELFDPKEKSAYAELIDGTEGIDQIIDRIKQRRVLVAVRPDGKIPPDEVEKLFHSLTEKNNLFILTGERSFEANKLEDAARELYATIAAQRDIREDNPQHAELMDRHEAAQSRLTSTIIGTYDRILVPIKTGQNPAELRSIPIQLTGGGTGGSGENVIIEALKKPPRKLFTDIAGDDFEALRSKVEATLWSKDDAAMYVDVERRARENASAYWLPPGGMKTLRDTAVQRGIWEDLGNGVISRKIMPKTPTVQLSPVKEPTATDPEAILEVVPVNASAQAILHYAEWTAATRNDPRVQGGKVTTQAPVIGVLIVDPSRADTSEAPNHSQTRWQSSLPIAHKVTKDETTNTRTVALYAHPDAKIRYSVDGTNPREHGTVYEEPFSVGAESALLIVHASITTPDELVFENTEQFKIAQDRGPEIIDPWDSADAGNPTSVKNTDGFYSINTRANAYKALDIMRSGLVSLYEADVRVQASSSGSKMFHVRVTGPSAPLKAETLATLLEQAHTIVDDDTASITLRFQRASASNMTYLQELDALLQNHVSVGQVHQP